MTKRSLYARCRVEFTVAGLLWAASFVPEARGLKTPGPHLKTIPTWPESQLKPGLTGLARDLPTLWARGLQTPGAWGGAERRPCPLCCVYRPRRRSGTVAAHRRAPERHRDPRRKRQCRSHVRVGSPAGHRRRRRTTGRDPSERRRAPAAVRSCGAASGCRSRGARRPECGRGGVSPEDTTGRDSQRGAPGAGRHYHYNW